MATTTNDNTSESRDRSTDEPIYEVRFTSGVRAYLTEVEFAERYPNDLWALRAAQKKVRTK